MSCSIALELGNEQALHNKKPDGVSFFERFKSIPLLQVIRINHDQIGYLSPQLISHTAVDLNSNCQYLNCVDGFALLWQLLYLQNI